MKHTLELTEEQIQQLFYFTEKHCVRHYDLQVELVDHLADAVTAKMNETTTPLSFEDAVQKVYAGFGVMGFSPIIASRQNAVLQQSNKEKLWLFKQYFTWPKAALTLLLVTVISAMPQILPVFWLKVVLYTGTAAFVVFEVTEMVKLHRQHKQQKQKLLLTENTYRAPAFAAVAIDLFCMFHGWDWFNDASAFSITRFYVYSGFLLGFFILSLSFINFTRRLHLKARLQYPAAFKMG